VAAEVSDETRAVAELERAGVPRMITGQAAGPYIDTPGALGSDGSRVYLFR